MVAMKPIQEWIGEPGVVISWHPSRASLAKVREAPVSDVPTSYQQEQHLLAYRKHLAEGTDMARLIIPGWDVPGQCDVRAMTHVINAYLRRHDTFHSWFEFAGSAGETGEIIRHTVTNPRDIKFVATEHGEMAAAEWRDHVMSTPDPWQWTASTSVSSSGPTISPSTSASTTCTPMRCSSGWRSSRST